MANQYFAELEIDERNSFLAIDLQFSSLDIDNQYSFMTISVPEITVDYFLLEDSFNLLLEDGGKLQLEA